jgi:hypothetical protein
MLVFVFADLIPTGKRNKKRSRQVLGHTDSNERGKNRQKHGSVGARKESEQRVTKYGEKTNERGGPNIGDTNESGPSIQPPKPTPETNKREMQHTTRRKKSPLTTSILIVVIALDLMRIILAIMLTIIMMLLMALLMRLVVRLVMLTVLVRVLVLVLVLLGLVLAQMIVLRIGFVEILHLFVRLGLALLVLQVIARVLELLVVHVVVRLVVVVLVAGLCESDRAGEGWESVE